MTTTMRRRAGVLSGCAAASAAALTLSAAPAQANTEVEWPDTFTSAFTSMATPGEVIDSDGNVSPGEPGAMGDFGFWINSDMDVICYQITLEGVTGDYESPAVTATHIHEAAAGEEGPPRLAFTDPEPVDDGVRTSSGCLQGPFTVGTTDDDGNDNAEGFTLAEIEANPSAFNADTHTEAFPDGTVRGQLMHVPLDGIETGGGGATSGVGTGTVAGAGAAAAALAGFAFFLLRRPLLQG